MVKAFLYGRLTQDPTKRDVSGNTVVELNIASDVGVDANKQKVTNFFRADVWGKRGENCATYLHKGDAVVVTGDLMMREYTKRDGSSGVSLDIRNADVQFGARSRNSGDAAPAAPAAPAAQNQPVTTTESDDLPF